MKTKVMLFFAGSAAAPLAFAAETARVGGLSVLEMLFLGLGAVILISQFVPALVLLGSMIYGLFSSASEDRTGTRELSERS